MSLFEQKNERKYFCISALAPQMDQIIKIMAHYHANSEIRSYKNEKKKNVLTWL